MGSATSKAKKNSQKETDPQRHPPSSRGKTLSDTKKILLLHKSGEEQLKVVKNFRDALTIAANGGIRVINSVNIDEGTDNFEGLPWLELELNNVILICLTSEAIVARSGWQMKTATFMEKFSAFRLGKTCLLNGRRRGSNEVHLMPEISTSGSQTWKSYWRKILKNRKKWMLLSPRSKEQIRTELIPFERNLFL